MHTTPKLVLVHLSAEQYFDDFGEKGTEVDWLLFRFLAMSAIEYGNSII